MATKELLKNSKWILIIMIVFAVTLHKLSHDIIILKDGTERKVKVAMVTNEKTMFTDAANKTALTESVDNTSVYMIKYEKRGNVFFTPDGKRITGDDDGKVPTTATVIYLLEGKEIVAYNVTLDNGEIKFNKNKKKGAEQFSIPSEIVFLIRYPDGTKDMMNSFEELKRREEEALAEKLRLEEEARLAELRSKFPKDAIVKTIKNVNIKVVLLSEDDNGVTYRKAGIKNSPIYNMDRTNIKDIEYINE